MRHIYQISQQYDYKNGCYAGLNKVTLIITTRYIKERDYPSANIAISTSLFSLLQRSDVTFATKTQID